MNIARMGRDPNPYLPPVREFFGYPGFDIEYGCLAELRSAVVEDDKIIVGSIAKRNARDLVIKEELAGTSYQAEPSDLATVAIHQIADQRHPYEKGLHDVLASAYPEIAGDGSLVQLYDYSIVSAIAARLNKSKQATVFKADRAEGLAPKQQEANIQRAILLAEELQPGDQLFIEQVERVYKALVPATVAIQQTMFDKTYLLDDWDGIGFRGIDLAV